MCGRTACTVRSGAAGPIGETGSEGRTRRLRLSVSSPATEQASGLPHRKDLALYTGLFNGEPVPAPGRLLRGWQDEAVDQMAAHMVELGFEVLDERPVVLADVPNDWGDPLLGALRVRRYGWETTGVVRIDSVGEVFIRLDPAAVVGPLLQPVPDEDGW